MSDLFVDFRRSLRRLRRSPGFAFAVVVCLALAIGASTAVFSVADALLWRRSTGVAPERLVRAFIDWANGLRFGAFSYPDYVDLRDRSKDVLAGFAIETPIPLHLSTGGRNERLWGSIASGNYFSVLGVEMSRGRAFSPAEDAAPLAHPVVVLSHGLWQRRFGGDEAVLGSSVQLNGEAFTVLGIAPVGFTGANAGLETDLWVPLAMQGVAAPTPTGYSLLEARGQHWLGFAIGRLADGVTLEQAEAALDAVMADLTATHPESNTGKRVVLYPEAEAGLHPFVRQGFAGFLGLMSSVVALVLLLACANVAGLLLLRALGREREMAIRRALGAGRGRLVRELLIESLALALSAGVAGLFLGHALSRGLVASLDVPVSVPLGLHLGLDGRLAGFALVVTVLTCVLFGLTPALQATGRGLARALARGFSAGGQASRLRRGLVVLQVALSLVLLIGAGLVLRSLAAVRQVELGFSPERQLIASVDVGLAGYSEEAGRSFFRTLEERLAALPGVESVGYAKLIPLSLLSYQTNTEPEGHVPREGEAGPSIDYNFVGRGYFEAMGVPLAEGRGFERADGGGPPVVVVNRTFARRFWGGEAIGKRIEIFGAEHRVVGVTADGKYFSVAEEPKPYLYLPIEQHYRAERTIHLRTAHDPAALAAAVRREVRALDEELPVYNLRPLADQLGFALFPYRVAASVAAAFAGLALLLAALGLYGVIAYRVSRGRRAIAIRMALGARPADIVRRVVGRGMLLGACGLALGLAAGALLARLVTGVLYGARAADPAAYLGACALLAGVVLVASWIPARRASRVDPMTALRAE